MLGKVMPVRLLQFWNAYSPIEDTWLGIAMLVRLLQFWKAYSPMGVTESGMLTEESHENRVYQCSRKRPSE